MKVWIVTHSWSDERTLRDYNEIAGVFSSKEKAEAKKKTLELEHAEWLENGRLHYKVCADYSCEITCHEVE